MHAHACVRACVCVDSSLRFVCSVLLSWPLPSAISHMTASPSLGTCPSPQAALSLEQGVTKGSGPIHVPGCWCAPPPSVLP